MAKKASVLAFVALMANVASRRDAAAPFDISSCTLPPSWRGSWFHGGFPQPLNVTDRVITNKGTCVHSVGPRYIIAEQ